MATDRQLQAILSSGEVTEVKIGGTATGDRAVKESNLTAQNVSIDNTGEIITSTTVGNSIHELANIGLAHMVTSATMTPFDATTTPTLANVFTTVKHQTTTTITADATTDRFTIVQAGFYRVYGLIFAEFASNASVGFILYKNGVAISPIIDLAGRGTGRPVTFSYTDLQEFSANDYVEVYVVSDSTTSVIVQGVSMIVERTIHA